jgi:hypothetical protein
MLIGKEEETGAKAVKLQKLTVKDAFTISEIDSEVSTGRAGNTLELIGTGKDFLNRTPAAQQLRERMDKWD